MGFSGALLALSAVQGITSIGKGIATSAEDKYNASLATNQAQLTAIQGQITQGQYTQQAGQAAATSTAIAGAKGLEPTGSVAAVMLNTQTQIDTDAAIAQFNTTMGINQANSKATALKQQAGQDMFSGVTSAFSDLLTGATNYATYNSKNALNLSGGANKT